MEQLFPLILVFLAMVAVFTGASFSPTPKFNDTNCVNALVGEYAVDDLYGMSLMAHAIRNRGTLKGVYGFHAGHLLRESTQTWQLARYAWLMSETEPDPLNGASEWRSTADVEERGHPKGFILVKEYNGTFFYKPMPKHQKRKR